MPHVKPEKLPEASRELVEHFEKLFHTSVVGPHTPYNEIIYEAGQQSVIRALRKRAGMDRPDVLLQRGQAGPPSPGS